MTVDTEKACDDTRECRIAFVVASRWRFQGRLGPTRGGRSWGPHLPLVRVGHAQHMQQLAQVHRLLVNAQMIHNMAGISGMMTSSLRLCYLIHRYLLEKEFFEARGASSFGW